MVKASAEFAVAVMNEEPHRQWCVARMANELPHLLDDPSSIRVWSRREAQQKMIIHRIGNKASDLKQPGASVQRFSL